MAKKQVKNTIFGLGIVLAIIGLGLVGVDAGKDYQLTILGKVEVSPNSLETYNIDVILDTPLDVDSSDGTFATRKANWVLINKDGTILQQGTQWKDVLDFYKETISLTTPSQVGDYAIVIAVTETIATFDQSTQPGEWKWGTEKVIKTEFIKFVVKEQPKEGGIFTLAGFTLGLQSIIGSILFLLGAGISSYAQARF